MCLHLRTLFPSPSKFNIVLMVMGSLTGRMASRPILPIKIPITTDTILNFDGNCNGDGVGKCKCTRSSRQSDH